MERTLYVCRCFNIEHSFCVSADEEDLFIEIHLSPLPLWKRVKHAIGYILGKRSRYGDFDEILLSPKDALRLGTNLIKWAENHG